MKIVPFKKYLLTILLLTATIGGDNSLFASATKGSNAGCGVEEFLSSFFSHENIGAHFREPKSTHFQTLSREIRAIYQTQIQKGNTPADIAKAGENFKHVSRMIKRMFYYQQHFKTLGINPEVQELAILLSDLGKSPALIEEAINIPLLDKKHPYHSTVVEVMKVFIRLYNSHNLDTPLQVKLDTGEIIIIDTLEKYALHVGRNGFKGFLNHEVVGIVLLKILKMKNLLTNAEYREALLAILWHNGPSVDGGWWGTMWAKEFLGRYPDPYPGGFLHTTLDREDQALLELMEMFENLDNQASLTVSKIEIEGGPKKILMDVILGKFDDFETALVGALMTNMVNTLVQMDRMIELVKESDISSKQKEVFYIIINDTINKISTVQMALKKAFQFKNPDTLSIVLEKNKIATVSIKPTDAPEKKLSQLKIFWSGVQKILESIGDKP